jgi:hypothetical protein
MTMNLKPPHINPIKLNPADLRNGLHDHIDGITILVQPGDNIGHRLPKPGKPRLLMRQVAPLQSVVDGLEDILYTLGSADDVEIRGIQLALELRHDLLD